MSTGGRPELTIPIRMDIAQALKDLAKLEQVGQKSAEETAKGVKKAESAISNLGSRVADLATHAGYGMVKDAVAAWSSGLQETANYAKQVSAEFIRFQESVQQVAALKGARNTGAFTSDQAREAAKAGVRPEEWAKFQEGFQSFAGASMDKLKTDKDKTDYQQKLVQFAKAKGINPAEIAQMGGGVLQFSKEQLTSDEAMTEIGKQFYALEKAPTEVSKLLPQMTRVQAQGATGAEASQLLNIASFGMPGEEGTGVESTLRALQDVILEEKGGQLGITKEMGPLERIRTAAENLEKRKAGGEDVGPLIKDLFPNPLEQRGIKTFMSQGVELGRFGQAEGFYKDTAADYTAKTIAEYEEDDRGKFARAQAEKARAAVTSGEKYQDMERLKLEAETKLMDSGRFEKISVQDQMLGMIGSKNEALVREEAMKMAVAANTAAGGTMTEFKKGGALEENEFNQEMIRITAETRDLTKKRAAEQERTGAPALSAPPPDPKTRPG